ncbi:hypothetical protein HY572_03020 [Candidatus Micrarchaeota archaeon]|nr:hypothetical protein [Candidatus Micrarchaeota archaeon]
MKPDEIIIQPDFVLAMRHVFVLIAAILFFGCVTQPGPVPSPSISVSIPPAPTSSPTALATPTPAPTIDACPEIYEPVCGRDKKTYSSTCHLKQAGAVQAYTGECGRAAKCAEEGGYLNDAVPTDAPFDYGKCCEGLVPYLKPGDIVGKCYRPENLPSVSQRAQDLCVSFCQTAQYVYQNYGTAEYDLTKGPCLSAMGPTPPRYDDFKGQWNPQFKDWVCDVAHDPRQPVDDLPENQCPEFGVSANHFVEVDENCNVIFVD